MMNCSICNKPINEGETLTMYTEKNSNKRLFAHDECLASIVARDLSEPSPDNESLPERNDATLVDKIVY